MPARGVAENIIAFELAVEAEGAFSGAHAVVAFFFTLQIPVGVYAGAFADGTGFRATTVPADDLFVHPAE
jgi:hypothetical protein